MAITVSQKELHRVAGTAIIYRRGKYLLLKRSEKEKAFPGKWTVPGGGLHPDDYLALPKTTDTTWYFAVDKSLRREIKEETNLEVGELIYLLDMAFVRPDGVPVAVFSYFAPYKSGKLKLLDKGLVEATRATARRARKFDLIEGILQEIEMVERILKGERISDREKLFKKLLRKKDLNY